MRGDASPSSAARRLLLGVALGLLLPAGCKQAAAPHPAANSAPAPTPTASIDLASSGTIDGTILFRGKPPAPIAIDMAADPGCPGMNATEQMVVHQGRMADVFVYVKDGLGSRLYAPPKTPVVLDQKDCRFVPHVIGAMTGQPVEFRNSDPTMHNVHILPPGSDDSLGLDISQPPGSAPQQHVFRAQGLMIPVRCNNHPWMQAMLNVVGNPFFAVSNAKGHFAITGLPPGTYTLVARQEQLGEQSRTVTVKSRKTTEITFTFGR